MRAMKPIALIPPLHPESESTIEKLEAELGTRLSPDYRQFLATTGGGLPDPDNCIFNDEGRSFLQTSIFINGFLTVQQIRDDLKNYRGRIPDGMFPMARDLSGNLILMGSRPEETGIYFWDHEQEDLAYEIIAEIPPLDRIQYFKVADSFSEFTDMLEPDDS